MLIPFDYLFRRHKIKANGVLHLGANSGQEAEQYAALGINKVIWVEALPSVYAKLLQHIRYFPTQRALLGCLSDRDGLPVTFHVSSNEAQSSSFLDFGTHSQEHPTVKWVDHVKLKTVRVDTLLRENGVEIDGPWFLNVDLQGAELLALRGMGDLLKQFDYAYVEVNEKELYKGCPLVGEIDAYLAAYGFVGVEKKMTGSGWGDKMFIKVK